MSDQILKMNSGLKTNYSKMAQLGINRLLWLTKRRCD